MRISPILATVALCFLAFSNAAPQQAEEPQQATVCAASCTEDNNPICAYDGNCYTQYLNQCVYDVHKCLKKYSLETVDLSLCELATKNSHHSYRMCD